MSWLAEKRVGWEGTSICKGPEAENEVCVLEVTKEGLWLEHQDEERASLRRQAGSQLWGHSAGHAYKILDLILFIKGRWWLNGMTFRWLLWSMEGMKEEW